MGGQGRAEVVLASTTFGGASGDVHVCAQRFYAPSDAEKKYGEEVWRRSTG